MENKERRKTAKGEGRWRKNGANAKERTADLNAAHSLPLGRNRELFPRDGWVWGDADGRDEDRVGVLPCGGR
jgi:hypothetical protein